MEQINRLKAYFIIEGSRGKFINATFYKKDRTLRRMTFRTGVKKGVKGEGLRYNPKDYLLLSVYDVEKQGFRMLNLNTLIGLNFEGKEYIVA